MQPSHVTAFYKSQAWKKTQAAYMESQNHVCERCKDVARVVHHRQYIGPHNINDPCITLDWANLEALCMDCHAQEHFGKAGCAEGLRFDSSGNIIKL